MNPPAQGWSLTVPPRLWRELQGHLFPAVGGAHGAVLLAGAADGPRGPRLLARDLILATDGVDYGPGTRGHHALDPTFVRDAALRAGDEGCAYLAVHCHGGSDSVGFSPDDWASHERGYPALRDLTGQLVGGLVLARAAAAGDLWLPDGGRAELAELVVPGNNLLRLRPAPPPPSARADATWDRQTRLFGDRGQELLAAMRVAVVGCGGVGSLVVELLARLGVGHLVLVDPDQIDPTNLPRLVAARRLDALPWLRGRDRPDRVRRLGDALAAPKVALAARNARRANSRVRITALRQDVARPQALDALAVCDWVFLAADTHIARHVVNAVVHQYGVPATQAGVKVPSVDGRVGQVHAVTRLVLPGSGCLHCNGLVDPAELALESAPTAEREAARYVADVPAPSVVTLNALAAAEAVDHFLLSVTGLHDDDDDDAAVVHRPRSRERDLQEPRRGEGCRWCGSGGALSRGEAIPLPALPGPSAGPAGTAGRLLTWVKDELERRDRDGQGS